jgi:hypothetical protein
MNESPTQNEIWEEEKYEALNGLETTTQTEEAEEEEV